MSEIDFAAHAAITMGTKDISPVLEQWSVGVHPYHTFADEVRPVLYGEVYGDFRFTDGKRIVTSEIKTFCWEKRKATTKNSTYFLGTPDAVFLKALEGSRKTLSDLDRND